MIPPVRDVGDSLPPGGPGRDPDCRVYSRAPMRSGELQDQVQVGRTRNSPTYGLRKDKRTVGGCPAEHPSDTPSVQCPKNHTNMGHCGTRQPEGSSHPTEECEVQAASLGDKWAVF